MEKYRVTLTLEERTELERLVSGGKAAARKLTHARILLLADALHGDEHADEAIVTALGASLKTVARVRKRLVTEGIEAAITPRPPPLRPIRARISMGSSGYHAVRLQLARPRVDSPRRDRGHQWPREAAVVMSSGEAVPSRLSGMRARRPPSRRKPR